MIIYDIDKIVRESITVRHRGKSYVAHEPTLKTWAEINSLNIEEGIKNDYIASAKKIIKLIVPDIDIEDLTRGELDLIFEVCFTVISGNHTGKKVAPAEIMTRV